MNLQSRVLICLLVSIGASHIAAEDGQNYLKAFPAAEDGMVRYVIDLPHKSREEDRNFIVELVVGKVMVTDGVNTMWHGGKIEAKPLKGWGFRFYEVEKLGPTASTLIAPLPGAPKVKRFVLGPSIKIPYNSRVPIVVYVPQGGEVRYRIWQTSGELEKAETK